MDRAVTHTARPVSGFRASPQPGTDEIRSFPTIEKIT